MADFADVLSPDNYGYRAWSPLGGLRLTDFCGSGKMAS